MEARSSLPARSRLCCVADLAGPDVRTRNERTCAEAHKDSRISRMTADTLPQKPELSPPLGESSVRWTAEKHSRNAGGRLPTDCVSSAASLPGSQRVPGHCVLRRSPPVCVRRCQSLLTRPGVLWDPAPAMWLHCLRRGSWERQCGELGGDGSAHQAWGHCVTPGRSGDWRALPLSLPRGLCQMLPTRGAALLQAWLLTGAPLHLRGLIPLCSLLALFLCSWRDQTSSGA